MDLPAAVATEAAMARQNVALSVVKKNAEQAQQVAQILDQSVRSAPVDAARGSNVNISA